MNEGKVLRNTRFLSQEGESLRGHPRGTVGKLKLVEVLERLSSSKKILDWFEATIYIYIYDIL